MLPAWRWWTLGCPWAACSVESHVPSTPRTESSQTLQLNRKRCKTLSVPSHPVLSFRVPKCTSYILSHLLNEKFSHLFFLNFRKVEHYWLSQSIVKSTMSWCHQQKVLSQWKRWVWSLVNVLLCWSYVEQHWQPSHFAELDILILEYAGTSYHKQYSTLASPPPIKKTDEPLYIWMWNDWQLDQRFVLLLSHINRHRGSPTHFPVSC